MHCEEKRFAWTGHGVDLFRGEPFDAAFLQLYPKGVVAVRVRHGCVLSESTVTCECREEVFPEVSICPGTATDRALMRLWTKAVDEERHPACAAFTCIVSRRHRVLRNGIGRLETFLKAARSEGLQACKLKGEWIQKGIQASGAAEKIRLDDAYVQRLTVAPACRGAVLDVEQRLGAPREPHGRTVDGAHVGRDRLPQGERWFRGVRARNAFQPAFCERDAR